MVKKRNKKGGIEQLDRPLDQIGIRDTNIWRTTTPVEISRLWGYSREKVRQDIEAGKLHARKPDERTVLVSVNDAIILYGWPCCEDDVDHGQLLLQVWLWIM